MSETGESLVHDIHMDQGNEGKFTQDDGVCHDGGLIFHFPAEERWTAGFLAFQSQSFHKDDTTGHATNGPDAASAGIRLAAVRLPGSAAATLVNCSAMAVTLDGWKLSNRKKQTIELTGTIDVDVFVTVPLHAEWLNPEGDSIMLMNADDLKIDGASYHRSQVNPGCTIQF